jgi:hypothetical protein
MQSGRRYNFLVIGGALLACLLFALVNSSVDPWRVSPVSWRLGGLEPYRDISSQIRTGKAGLIRSGDWDVGLFGSSRVDNAWNPRAAGWQDRRVVNLGASGGFIYETLGIARHFLAREKPELLVIGIDPGDLASDLDTRPLSDYASSPFGEVDGLNRELRYVFGLSTFEASLEVLRRAGTRQLAEYTPEGLRLRPEVARSRSQMKFIRDQLRGSRDESGGAVNPAKAALLRDFLRDCAGGPARVVLVLHPVHALMHARARDLPDPPVLFEETRRFLLDATLEANRLNPTAPFVRYWDFCNFHPAHCEPLPADKQGLDRMRHWNDLGHYDVALGESVLGHALGWQPLRPEWRDQGREITPETLEPYLATVREGYRAYLAGPGAADVAWKESLLAPAPPHRP